MTAPDAAPDAPVTPLLPDAPVAQDLAPDRPPPVDLGPAPRCEQLGTFTACLDRGDGRIHARRREGRQCGLCRLGRDAAPGSAAHCTMGDPDDSIVHCARSCFDCCHIVRGAPCETSDDCCLPLRCTGQGSLRLCDQ